MTSDILIVSKSKEVEYPALRTCEKCEIHRAEVAGIIREIWENNIKISVKMQQI
jgi:hypothetical protein